jgi:hypothetical protein
VYEVEGALMVSVTHGPSGLEVPGVLLIPEIVTGLGLAITTLRGSLPTADKALLASAYPVQGASYMRSLNLLSSAPVEGGGGSSGRTAYVRVQPIFFTE